MDRNPMDDPIVAAAFEDFAERSSRAVILSAVRSLIQGGATPNQACRLASFMLIQELGSAALDELGIPEATFYRWRSEIRKFTAGADSWLTEQEDAAVDRPRSLQ